MFTKGNIFQLLVISATILNYFVILTFPLGKNEFRILRNLAKNFFAIASVTPTFAPVRKQEGKPPFTTDEVKLT